MAVRETCRMVSPFSVSGCGAASFAGPMSALSPLPNAAAFAIPDFVASLRGGKLIRRGISYLPAVPPAGQYRRERVELRNYQIFQINGISLGGSDSGPTHFDQSSVIWSLSSDQFSRSFEGK
jgi:hypothetical protein